MQGEAGKKGESSRSGGSLGHYVTAAVAHTPAWLQELNILTGFSCLLWLLITNTNYKSFNIKISSSFPLCTHAASVNVAFVGRCSDSTLLDHQKGSSISTDISGAVYRSHADPYLCSCFLLIDTSLMFLFSCETDLLMYKPDILGEPGFPAHLQFM